MAEFCVDCWNDLNGTHYTENELWLEDDLCEGCGEVKPCIITLRRKPLIFQAFGAIIRKIKDHR